MKFTLSTIALVATLLTQETLAGVVAFHPRHGYKHAAVRREASEAAEAVGAPEMVARAVVYVTNTITRVVTVAGGVANVNAAAPTPAPQADQGAIDAANFQGTKMARISLLQHQASVALENWSRTKDQQQTTLQIVAAAAPTPAPEAPKPAAPAAPAAEAQVEAPAQPDTQVAVFVEQPQHSAPSGGKRGLAYNEANLVKQLLAGTTGKASWAYNWGSTPGDLPAGIEYVPMLWGVQADHTGNWIERANSAIASGSTHLLAFNEPDHNEQARVDPGTCAQAYKTHVQPFAGKARLGAPAVTNGGGEMGLTYLRNFMNACSGCTIDFVPIHWYDSAGNFEYFKKHVEDAKTVAGGRPLWITEFGAAGSDAEQAAFLGQALSWLESQDYVERYAYFWVDKLLVTNPTIAAAYFSG